MQQCSRRRSSSSSGMPAVSGKCTTAGSSPTLASSGGSQAGLSCHNNDQTHACTPCFCCPARPQLTPTLALACAMRPKLTELVVESARDEASAVALMVSAAPAVVRAMVVVPSCVATAVATSGLPVTVRPALASRAPPLTARPLVADTVPLSTTLPLTTRFPLMVTFWRSGRGSGAGEVGSGANAGCSKAHLPCRPGSGAVPD